jgi:hypothetical protein
MPGTVPLKRKGPRSNTILTSMLTKRIALEVIWWRFWPLPVKTPASASTGEFERKMQKSKVANEERTKEMCFMLILPTEDCRQYTCPKNSSHLHCTLI